MTDHANELRRLAQAATPGPWVSHGRYIGTPRHMSYIGEVRDQCGNWSDTEKSRADAAFISAANPAAISELLDRFETAEKERDALRAALQHEADCVEAAKAEIEALRAKIETAENDAAHQKALAASALRVAEGWERKCGELRAKIAGLVPIGLLHVGGYYGEELQDWEFEADQQACDRLNEAHFQREAALNLYARTGAKGEEK